MSIMNGLISPTAFHSIVSAKHNRLYRKRDGKLISFSNFRVKSMKKVFILLATLVIVHRRWIIGSIKIPNLHPGDSHVSS